MYLFRVNQVYRKSIWTVFERSKKQHKRFLSLSRVVTSNPTIECVDTGGRSGGQRPEVAVEVAVEAVTGLYVAMWNLVLEAKTYWYQGKRLILGRQMWGRYCYFILITYFRYVRTLVDVYCFLYNHLPSLLVVKFCSAWGIRQSILHMYYPSKSNASFISRKRR